MDPPMPPIRPRPTSRQFRFPTKRNPDGTESTKVVLFFKRVAGGQLYVVYGLTDSGCGAYFEPFEHLTEDTTYATNVFRETTGCLGSWALLSSDHDNDRCLLSPTNQLPIQALIFRNLHSRTHNDFVNESLSQLIIFINRHPAFNTLQNLSNYSYDVHMSDDTTREDDGVMRSLDQIIITPDVRDYIHQSHCAQHCLPPGVHQSLPPFQLPVPHELTCTFFSRFPRHRDIYFARKTDGSYPNIARVLFGYP